MKKKTLTGFFSALTFLLAAVALQLYFNKDYYFAMNRAKCSFTMIVLIGAVITALVRPVESIWKKQDKQKMILLDWCVLIFGCSSIITCVLSQAPELTLVGTKGMFVGAFTYFTGMLVYFVVSRNMIPYKWIMGVLIACWTIIIMWTIVNRCGKDLFGMHENMRPGDLWRYVSSMGNINSASDAFATIVPFVVILWLMACGKSRCLYAAVCYIGFLAICSLNCEGVYIGLLTAVPLIVISAISDVRKVKNAILLLLVLGLSISTYHFLYICSVIETPSGAMYTLSGFWMGEVLTVIAVLLFFLYSNGNMKLNDRLIRIIRVSLSWICVAVVVGFVALSVIKSFYDINYGDTRGAIWKGCVWSFRLYNPIEMIFGQGSGMFAENVTLAFSMLFDKEAPYTYATCHNSLLQALLGNGIIGLLCLLTGLYALIRDWFRDLRPIVLRPMSKYESIRNVEFTEMIRVASFTAIMGYFGASLVESTYPHTVMLLFAMLALYRSSYFVPRKKKKPVNPEI